MLPACIIREFGKKYNLYNMKREELFNYFDKNNIIVTKDSIHKVIDDLKKPKKYMKVFGVKLPKNSTYDIIKNELKNKVNNIYNITKNISICPSSESILDLPDVAKQLIKSYIF